VEDYWAPTYKQWVSPAFNAALESPSEDLIKKGYTVITVNAFLFVYLLCLLLTNTIAGP